MPPKKAKETMWLKPKSVAVLYDAVCPTALTLEEFTTALQDGTLSATYKLSELKKLQMELCDLLCKEAHLREAKDLKAITKKEALSEALTALATVGPKAPKPASVPVAKETTQPPPAELTPTAVTELPRSTVPVRPLISALQSPRFEGAAAARPTAEFESPLSPIVSTLMRMSVRQLGSQTHTFETPRQYAAELASRAFRVVVVPVTGVATPCCWPKVKDVFVFVNGRPVLTQWKRSWPQRRTEVAKGYLPLDISPMLEREGVQKLQVDCFAKDYCGALAVQLVRVVSETDAVRHIMEQFTPRTATLLAYYASISRSVDDPDDVQCCDAVVAAKCPILQSRIQVPMRGVKCRHLQCFDVGGFVRSCHIGCFWNCPICDAPIVPSRDIVVDSLLLAALCSSTATHFTLDAERLIWGPAGRGSAGHVDLSDNDDSNSPPPIGRKRSRDEWQAPTGMAGSADDPICL
jgi:hypothetical protein